MVPLYRAINKCILYQRSAEGRRSDRVTKGRNPNQLELERRRSSALSRLKTRVMDIHVHGAAGAALVVHFITVKCEAKELHLALPYFHPLVEFGEFVCTCISISGYALRDDNFILEL